MSGTINSMEVSNYTVHSSSPKVIAWSVAPALMLLVCCLSAVVTICLRGVRHARAYLGLL